MMDFHFGPGLKMFSLIKESTNSVLCFPRHFQIQGMEGKVKAIPDNNGKCKENKAMISISED